MKAARSPAHLLIKWAWAVRLARKTAPWRSLWRRSCPSREWSGAYTRRIEYCWWKKCPKGLISLREWILSEWNSGGRIRQHQYPVYLFFASVSQSVGFWRCLTYLWGKKPLWFVGVQCEIRFKFAVFSNLSYLEVGALGCNHFTL